jgi:hypothetical protein
MGRKFVIYFTGGAGTAMLFLSLALQDNLFAEIGVFSLIICLIIPIFTKAYR